MSEIRFGGPPPPPRGRHVDELNELREACRGRPNEWAQLECQDRSSAGARAQLLRQQGFEATSRGPTLYARWNGE